MSLKGFLPYISRDEKFMRAIMRQRKFFGGGYKHLAYLTHYYIYYKWHCDISFRASIASTVTFPHPIGIVIGDGCVIGEGTMIYQNVTLGQKQDKYPSIGKNCTIYPNAIIIGDIDVADGTIIGAGSVVIKSTEANSVYAGNPAERIDSNKP